MGAGSSRGAGRGGAGSVPASSGGEGGGAVSPRSPTVAGIGGSPPPPPPPAWEDPFAPGSIASGSLSASAAALSSTLPPGGTAAIPDGLDIVGVPEVGSELRVRGAGIEALAVTWFRLPGDAPLPDAAAVRDIARVAGFAPIAGASTDA
jgi:hypothetical protein